jgi:rhodanese-related sulfurtransferase
MAGLFSVPVREEPMRYQLLSKNEFRRVLKNARVQLIDLREESAYQAWHIPGAENRSYDNIREWAGELDEGLPVLLYCAHGNESILAARYLSGRGYRVASLIGGIGGL